MQELPVIIAVDDEELIRDLIQDALMEGGFACAIVGSAEEGLALFSSCKQAYRALVTDLNLGRGRMNGWELATRVREIEPEFPVVYISGDSGHERGSKGVPNSILIQKPFAPASSSRLSRSC